jgi:hypothetical protein
MCYGFPLLSKAAVDLVEKRYEKHLLNIPCNFSVDFTGHLIKNLEEYGISVV